MTTDIGDPACPVCLTPTEIRGDVHPYFYCPHCNMPVIPTGRRKPSFFDGDTQPL